MNDVRYVVIGAGAVGGTIGGLLAEHGHEVCLLARGEHLETIRKQGLELRNPAGTRTLDIPVAGRPTEIEWRTDDVVIMATKSQDTGDALESLADAWPSPLPVLCAQNGVNNERLALRYTSDVYGLSVQVAASFVDPGVVSCFGTPRPGIVDIGRYPEGSDERCSLVAADLQSCGFSSEVQSQIMRWKYGKLVFNVGNVIDAASESSPELGAVVGHAREEAARCLAAAAIDFVSTEETAARRDGIAGPGLINGAGPPGGSTWQSLLRRAASVETDFLNGEIVLLGRLTGVATPVNEYLQALGRQLTSTSAEPRSIAASEIISRAQEAPRGSFDTPPRTYPA